MTSPCVRKYKPTRTTTAVRPGQPNFSSHSDSPIDALTEICVPPSHISPLHARSPHSSSSLLSTQMWKLDVHSAETEFIRNIRLGSNTTGDGSSGSTKRTPKAMLESFLHDLSFWDAPEAVETSSSTSDGNHQQTPPIKRQTDQINTLSDTTSVASGNSNGSSKGSAYNKMRLQDRSYRRRSSSGSPADGAAASTTTNTVVEPIVWKTAVDPTSGRTYYYDSATRKTQWHKVRICLTARTMHTNVLQYASYSFWLFLFCRRLCAIAT
jgi:hypothetical protein